MKTENLVEALVADHGIKGAKPMRRSLVVALLAGGLVSLAVFLIEFGPRADLMEGLATWRFELKVGMVLAALVVAFSLCIALSRPLASRRTGHGLLALAGLALAAVVIELAVLPSASWATRLVGSNAVICLVTIPTLALAPLAAVLVALRNAAPASPARAGAAAGLLAAAAGAAFYAFHCFDDSPLFVVTWYTLAAVPVIVLGAAAGHRLLRW